MRSLRALATTVFLLGVVASGVGGGVLGSSGCGADVDRVASRSQGLCLPGDMGGDVGCGCTLNSQCTRFDEDTRLIVCDVPEGAAAGTCTDCLALGSGKRVVGCACASDTDCATGLACNGRTCQLKRARGEYCFRDSDCGTDMLGAMRCLPTKSWCGPLENDYYCDFNSDCISGKCQSGLCIPGGTSTPCRSDGDCRAPLVCSTVYGTCIDKQPDGKPCTRNAECQNQCNSFSGVCLQGKNGVICTPSNPDGDCESTLVCTDCGGSYTCRAAGGPCG